MELNEYFQSLAKQLQNTARTDTQDRQALVEIEKCLNKLRIAIWGLRIQDQRLKTLIADSLNCLLRYHIPGDVRNRPYHIAVALYSIWGFGLHPFTPSAKLFAIQEFMECSIFKRVRIKLMTYFRTDKK
jgi:hypothetical protein